MTLLILLMIGTFFGYALIAKRSEKTRPGISRFFMYGHEMPVAAFFSTVSGSSISLGAAILAFLSLGYYLPWIAIIAIVTWIVGFYFHYVVMKKALVRYPDLSSKTFTLHGYLGHAYNSEALPVIASIASIIGFTGAYGVEMVAITKITAPFFSDPMHEVLVLLFMAGFIGWYATRGGFVSVVKTDKAQLWIFLVGILATLGFVIYKFTTEDYVSTILSSLRINDHSFPFAILLGILVINIPWQMIDMSQWQRSLSCSSVHVVRNGLLYSSVGIAISWALLIALGLFMHGMELKGDPVSTLLSVFSGHNAWYGFFMIAAIAALFSTADSYIIAASQTYICDVKYPEVLEDDEEITANQSTNEKIMNEAKRSVWVIAFAGPVVAYGAHLIIPNLLEMFFMVFSAQLSLVPAVVASVGNKAPGRMAAIVSIVLGLATAAILFIYNLLYTVENLIFYSPVATLVVSVATFLALSSLNARKSLSGEA